MSKRVRESGHTYRMKKAKRDREAAALSGSMNKFLTVQPKPGSSTTEEKSESFESNDETELSGNDTEGAKRSETQREDDVQSDSEKQIEPVEFDPHTWPNVLPDSFRELIVKTGVPPIQNPAQIIHSTMAVVSTTKSSMPHMPMEQFISATGYSTQSLVIQCIVCFA